MNSLQAAELACRVALLCNGCDPGPQECYSFASQHCNDPDFERLVVEWADRERRRRWTEVGRCYEK